MQDPWTKSVPFHGCIAKTQKEAKSVVSKRAPGKSLRINGNFWECSACASAAAEIEDSVSRGLALGSEGRLTAAAAGQGQGWRHGPQSTHQSPPLPREKQRNPKVASMGTGDLQQEVRTRRTTCNQLEQHMASRDRKIERQNTRLEEQDAELKELRRRSTQLKVVEESVIHKAMQVIHDHDMEGAFGSDFKCFGNMFEDLSSSVLDGRLPIASIPMLKIMTIVANCRKDYTSHFRFPHQLKEYVSQLLLCDGPWQAVNLTRGPVGANQG